MQNPQKHQIIFSPQSAFNPGDSLFFLGSCFSDVIAEKCNLQTPIQVLSNPYGTLFHPIALLQNLHLLNTIKENESSHALLEIVEAHLGKSLFQHHQQYHSLLHAYKFNNNNKLALIQEITQIGLDTVKFLKNSSAIFITLGTAIYYHHLPSNTPVGNCHKLPQLQFEKRLSSVTELQLQIQEIHEMAEKISPGKPIIFTISPVRHLRDGMQTSAISKSLLQVALHQYLGAEKYQNTAFYFPSYEYITEEKAENPKYKFDGMHILEEHENSIFQKFLETYALFKFPN